jgi:hypothetical protein
LFLALENPEKFFKDEKKTRILYDRWKGTLDDWKVEITDTGPEATVKM